MACSKYEKIKEAQEVLERLTADPEVRNELLRKEIIIEATGLNKEEVKKL